MVQKTIYATFVALTLAACGGKSEEEKAKEEVTVGVTDAVGAMQNMAKQMEEAGKNGPVETVNFRELKELLPTEAAGLPRKEATGEKTGAMGIQVSTASGNYASADGTQTIDLDVVDAGGTGAMMGLAAWTMVDVDKETEGGFERTTTRGDYKAYEKYDNASKEGEVAVIVKNRFVVTVKGRGVSFDQIKTALDGVDLDKLAGMK